ncbi:MAG: type II toxin-antitoxin system Phd/YefM family antitoxin [Pseudobdellovibrionaceae bacterium]
MSSKVYGASKFKEQCLSILDNLDKDGVIITKNGRPVAKLITLESDRSNQIGKFKDIIKVKGDTKTTGIKWNVES